MATTPGDSEGTRSAPSPTLPPARDSDITTSVSVAVQTKLGQMQDCGLAVSALAGGRGQLFARQLPASLGELFALRRDHLRHQRWHFGRIGLL